MLFVGGGLLLVVGCVFVVCCALLVNCCAWRVVPRVFIVVRCLMFVVCCPFLFQIRFCVLWCIVCWMLLVLVGCSVFSV